MLSHWQKNEILRFVTENNLCEKSYVESRFIAYNEIVVAYDESKIKSVQFVTRFTEKNVVYVYFGPLFSIEASYISMFYSYYQWLKSVHSPLPIYLAAEFQNPNLLLVYQALFGEFLYPQVTQIKVPNHIQSVAKTFQKSIPHISNLDVHLFKTSGTETLYRDKYASHPVTKWLASRNIHLQQGDALFVVIDSHEKILEQLEENISKLQNWAPHRTQILEKFVQNMAN